MESIERREAATPSPEVPAQESRTQKPWETPHFEQHDVRSLTLGKTFNALETDVTVGPAS